jgi:uncharacterized membrane protein YraQ (UPF0718 family)
MRQTTESVFLLLFLAFHLRLNQLVVADVIRALLLAVVIGCWLRSFVRKLNIMSENKHIEYELQPTS